MQQTYTNEANSYYIEIINISIAQIDVIRERIAITFKLKKWKLEFWIEELEKRD